MIYKYPNVILNTDALVHYPAFRKPDGTILDLVVRERMAQLLDALAVKYPLYRFELNNAGRISPNEIEATNFDVFNGANPREHIGSVGIATRYNRNGQCEQIYTIHNKRIAMSRERGERVETKHLKVALKTVDKFFAPAPWSERLDEAYDQGEHYIQQATSEALRRLRQIDVTMHDIIHNFVTSKWNEFLASLSPNDAATAEQRVELYLSHQSMRKLHTEAAGKRNMLTVIIENDKYVIQSAGLVTSYNSEQLPQEVRMKIGMLKLTKEREVLPDIGVKTQAGYLIMIDPQPEGA